MLLKYFGTIEEKMCVASYLNEPVILRIQCMSSVPLEAENLQITIKIFMSTPSYLTMPIPGFERTRIIPSVSMMNLLSTLL